MRGIAWNKQKKQHIAHRTHTRVRLYTIEHCLTHLLLWPLFAYLEIRITGFFFALRL